MNIPSLVRFRSHHCSYWSLLQIGGQKNALIGRGQLASSHPPNCLQDSFFRRVCHMAYPETSNGFPWLAEFGQNSEAWPWRPFPGCAPNILTSNPYLFSWPSMPKVKTQTHERKPSFLPLKNKCLKIFKPHIIQQPLYAHPFAESSFKNMNPNTNIKKTRINNTCYNKLKKKHTIKPNNWRVAIVLC